MSLSPDPPPPSSPPPKPKMTAEERRARQTDQLMRIRHCVMIGRELDERGITTPTGVGAALGMAPAEAMALLSRHQFREGDLLLLQAAADRLGLHVPKLDPWHLWTVFADPPPKPRLTVKKHLTREAEKQRAIELRLMIWEPRLPPHPGQPPADRMSFGVAGTITPLIDLWLEERRLPDYMRSSPKAGR